MNQLLFSDSNLQNNVNYNLLVQNIFSSYFVEVIVVFNKNVRIMIHN